MRKKNKKQNKRKTPAEIFPRESEKKIKQQNDGILFSPLPSETAGSSSLFF